jgi:hypothetical protein
MSLTTDSFVKYLVFSQPTMNEKIEKFMRMNF